LKSLVVLDTVDSTQDEVTRRLKAGAPVDAILAYEQTAGRGRFGREWISPKHECLALSIAWHEATNWHWPEGLALAAGLVAAETFDTRIAWPNDLLVRGKKVGGILSEIVTCPLGRVPVIGLGVNLALTEPPDGVPWASSLVLEGRHLLVPLDAAAAFLEAIASQPLPGSFADLEGSWRKRDASAAKCFKLPDGRIATAVRVCEDGSLEVDADGEFIRVTSAEAIYGSGS
jgi:BirA family biotin operon repressor/biotin-[acetyl-CoA-carboxylase] ligase